MTIEIPAFPADPPFPLTPPDVNPEAVIATLVFASDVEDFPDFYSQGTEASLYTSWQIDNVYKTRAMRVQMPIANSPTVGLPNYAQTSSFVQLSGYQTRRIIRVSAERVGDEPEFPDPDNLPAFLIPLGLSSAQAITQTFLFMKLKPSTVTVSTLGQLVYRASAEYHIGLSRAPNPGERLSLGNDKWTSFGNQNTLSNGNLTSSDW